MMIGRWGDEEMGKSGEKDLERVQALVILVLKKLVSQG